MSLLYVELKRPDGKYWHCEIPGEAMPWKRAGRNLGRTFNKSRDDQDAFAWSVKAALPGIRCDRGEKKYGLRLRFFSSMGPFLQGDWDNLAKNIGDALQRVVWKNDAMICEGFAQKIPSNNPRTEVLIYEVTDSYLAQFEDLS